MSNLKATKRENSTSGSNNILRAEKLCKSYSPISKFTLGSNRQINKKLNIDFAISYYTTNYKYDDIFPTAWESPLPRLPVENCMP